MTVSTHPHHADTAAAAAADLPLARPGKLPRLLSLDAFRGLTIAAMILANNPGSWGHIYEPLEHAAWHGWTPTDLIFPFFLFIVGAAIPFAFAARTTRGASRSELALGVVSRSVSLVLLGLLLHSVPSRLPAALPDGFGLLRVLQFAVYPFVPAAFVLLLWPWASAKRSAVVTAGVAAGWVLLFLLLNHQVTQAARMLGAAHDFGTGLLDPRAVRFPGVLQRIGVCYLVAGLLGLAGKRGVIATAAVASLAYLLLMMTVSLDGSVPGSFERGTNLARAVDLAVFGPAHAYKAYPDPEGLLSTLPAITTTLIGLLVGTKLRSDKPIAERCAGLMSVGVVLAVAGVLIGWWVVPINKQLWTPSYAVFSAGLGCLGLGAMFYAIDVRGRRAWAWPLMAMGMNAILVFLLSGIVARLMGLVTVPGSWLPAGGTAAARPGSVGIRAVFTGWATHLQQAATPAGWHSPEAASLAYGIGFLTAMWMLAAVCYRMRWFVKV